MLRTASCALTAALFLAGCDQSSAPTEFSTAPTQTPGLAATVRHQTLRFIFITGGFNACTNEETPGTGKFFSHTTVVERPGGGLHFATTINISYLLIGATTGNRYRGKDVEHVNFTTNGRQQSVQTFIANLRMGTAGPRNNFVLRVRVHVTVNANGVVTVSRDDATFECR